MSGYTVYHMSSHLQSSWTQRWISEYLEYGNGGRQVVDLTHIQAFKLGHDCPIQFYQPKQKFTWILQNFSHEKPSKFCTPLPRYQYLLCRLEGRSAFLKLHTTHAHACTHI